MSVAIDRTPLPAFRESSLWLGPSSRRSRWWFADGAWLDQKQLAAPVSFALTHWCADRGLQGEEFGDAFALGLRKEINLAAGNAEDAEVGESPDVGVRVLAGKGLVAETYQCEGIEAVLTALLERGPLMASLTWYSSFQYPKEVSGTAVAKLDTDAGVQGGHAVLLNGVSLDLEIDGVKGFVRLKNSWGRQWADHGQCLVSLADLETVLSGASFALSPWNQPPP